MKVRTHLTSHFLFKIDFVLQILLVCFFDVFIGVDRNLLGTSIKIVFERNVNRQMKISLENALHLMSQRIQ